MNLVYPWGPFLLPEYLSVSGEGLTIKKLPSRTAFNH